MNEHNETRWALAMKFEGRMSLLGKYCWPNATATEPRIRTFATRQDARTAKAASCYSKEAMVVKVNVTIKHALPTKEIDR